jgi:HEAT repeat protein
VAFTLGGLGPEAVRAIPQLQNALGDSDAGVRLSAAQALWAVRLKSDDVLLVMTNILKERDASLRARAAAALSRLGSKATPAIAELFSLIHDDDAKVRIAAVQALAEIGGPLARATYPRLAELADDDEADESLRRAAAQALKKIGRPSKTDVHTLINALDHPHAEFRAGVAVSLWMLNRDAKPAVPALSRKLSDPDENVRATAALALAAIGPDAADAVPELITALKQKDDELLRTRAAYTLGEIGSRAAGAVEALNRVLAGADEKLALRVYAAQSLWAISQQTRDVVAVLGKGIEKLEEDELRVSAAEVLGRIAVAAPGADVDLRTTLKNHAVPALLKGLRDEDDGLRLAAAGALGAIGYEAQDAVPLLLHSLEDEDAEIRAAICEALGRIAAAETQVVRRAQRTKAAYSALLFHGKVDQSDRVQRAANVALGKIGRPVPEDVDVLLGIVEDKNQAVFFRNAAAQVLGLLGAEAKPAAARLGRILSSREDPGVRVLAAYALAEIGEGAKSQQDALLAALKDIDPGLRVAAAYALGEIFAGSRMTVPGPVAALQEAANAAEENLAASARAALKKINP